MRNEGYKMYYSFIMLKPDALERGLVEEVLLYLRNGGIDLEMVSYKIATRDMICCHYADCIVKYGEDFKRKASDYFEGKYVIPILVRSEQPDVIARVRQIVGATDPSKAEKGTIRGDLGIDSMQASLDESRCCENLIHASDCAEAVRAESAIWFGPDVLKKYWK